MEHPVSDQHSHFIQGQDSTGLRLLTVMFLGNWKTLKAGTTEMENVNGNRTTPFFAYCFDDQVSSRRPPCSTPRLADKR